MKVKDIISELSSFDPEKELVIADRDNGTVWEVRGTVVDTIQNTVTDSEEELAIIYF